MANQPIFTKAIVALRFTHIHVSNEVYVLYQYKKIIHQNLRNIYE